MKNAWIGLGLILVLAACAGPRDAGVDAVDNSDVHALTCDKIAAERERAQQLVENLRSQNRLSNAGNAVAVGAALLSFNPQSLFDIRSGAKIKEALTSYEERVKRLDERSQELNCSQ